MLRKLLLALPFLLLCTQAEADFPHIRDTASSAESSDVTDHPIPNPVWSQAGDVAVVTFTVDTVETPNWPSSTYCTGNAWTNLVGPTSDGDSLTTSEIRYCVLDAAMSGTENIATGSEQASIQVTIIRKDTYVGNPTAVAFSCTGVAGGSSTIDFPSHTSGFGAVDTLWLAIVAGDGNGAMRAISTTPDLSWQKFFFAQTSASTARANIGIAWKLANASSQDPGTDIMTNSNATEDWCATVVAIQGQAIPASGGGSGGPRIFH